MKTSEVHIPHHTKRDVRIEWILAGIWLLFLFFPIAALWGGDLTFTIKLATTVLTAVFVAVYLDGFRRWTSYELARASQSPALVDYGVVSSSPVTPSYSSSRHLAALAVVTVLVIALGGVGMLGVMPFVVSFAIFTARLAVAGVVFVVGIVGAVGLLVLTDMLSELWFLPAIVAGVSAACVLIRLSEGRRAERTDLLTRLAISDERTRLARDVHDVLGHSLTVVILKAELCDRLLARAQPVVAADSDVERCRTELAELQTASRRALAEIRSTVGGLRNPVLEDELTAARTVLADAGVRLVVSGDPADVPVRYRPVLAWVVRESVTNIVRHARATTTEISLQPGGDQAGSQILLRISDDGVGTDPEAEGNGLRGLRERLQAVDGMLRINRDADGGLDGTQLEVVV